MEDDVLAKAFCAIAMTIRPGPRNTRNGTLPAIRTTPPSASAKTA